jgi:hypothetical protein
MPPVLRAGQGLTLSSTTLFIATFFSFLPFRSLLWSPE